MNDLIGIGAAKVGGLNIIIFIAPRYFYQDKLK